MLSHFSATDVSMSHNDERWHSTELTGTGSAAQRPQETGSNRGWAVRVTYGYSWGGLGSRRKMRCDEYPKCRNEKERKKEIRSKSEARRRRGLCVDKQHNRRAERERGAESESITSFVLKGQSQASDLKLKWSVGLAPFPPRYSMERECLCAHVCVQHNTTCVHIHPLFPQFYILCVA